MSQQFDQKKLATFPKKPGVYLMKSASHAVLYIGKAKNLQARVKQYFFAHGDERQMIPFLMAKVANIDTIVVKSEKEALLLENTLIKLHKPRYNALLKDDKSYIALKINNKHEWPKVDLVRYRGRPKPDGLYFGPYTNAKAARETLDLLNRLFPLRQCSDQELKRRQRPCILYDMKRCIAPCVGYCTHEEYQQHLKRTVRFLQGKDRAVLSNLKKQMESYSAALEYEKAGKVLTLLRRIEKTVEKQHVDTPLGGDADVWGIYREAGEVILSQMVVRSGRLIGCVPHTFSAIAQDNQALFESFLLQQYQDLTDIPKEILISEQLQQAPLLGEIFSESAKKQVALICPKRGQKRTLVQMAVENAQATFKQERDQKQVMEKILLEMQEKFRLNCYPNHIECIDNSTLFGEHSVSAIVAFIEGEKYTKGYRTYKIKAEDDYQAMREVLMRRFKRAEKENNLPDLLIVDGGKGHLNCALAVLQELNIISCNLIAVAKEKGNHGKGMTEERVFLPNVKDPLHFKSHSQVLFFLQRVRDEAHRFVINFHRKRRKKGLLKSAVDEIRGIGPVKKKALLRHFGSWKRILAASEEQLHEVKELTKRDIQTLKTKCKSSKQPTP